MILLRGFAKKGYTSLFLRQKGAHLENEKMRQQSCQEDQNATRDKEKPLGFNGRYTVSALTLIGGGIVNDTVFLNKEGEQVEYSIFVLRALDSQI